MPARPRPRTASPGPLPVIPDDDDAALVGAVVAHYAERLTGAPDLAALLACVGVNLEVATRLTLGWSDRTLGLRLPKRQWKAGGLLRERLTALGVLRPSGHETFRGCLVVPVTDRDGHVVGLFGRRTDGRGKPLWATGLPGGIFCDEAPSPDLLLVVATIPEALEVLSAGRDHVVAPGRPGGFSRRDLTALARRDQPLVVVGRGNEKLAERLAALGADVSVAGPDVVLHRVVATASDPLGALTALVRQARPVGTDDGTGSGTPGAAPAPAAPPVETSPAPVPASPAAVLPVPPAPASAPSIAPETPPATPPALPVVPPAAVTPTSAPAPRATVEVTEGADEVFVRFCARSWRIRGAAKHTNRTTDALKAALSVTDTTSGRFHLDTLDLYVARQRSAFLVAAEAELRTDGTTLRAELAEVLAAAEGARDRAEEPTGPTVPEMTAAERDEAMALLTAPDLLERVAADLADMGVVGESTNLVVSYLATVSRLTERPFGVLVQSTSAAGKSTLTDAVCSLVPKEHLVSVSALTAQALYYLSGGDLAHKVLCVAEDQGAARAAYALKLLVSDAKLSIAAAGKDRSTGRLTTASYEVAGPVALMMTTTAAVIDPELENRLVVLGVDEGTEQTRAILAAQRQAATAEGLFARTRRDHLRRLHQNAQRLLRPYPVVVPDLAVEFPATATRHRRDHQKLLALVQAVTLLHQHQREVQAQEVDGTTLTYLEATPDDVATALHLATAVLARSADDLAPQPRRLLDALVAHTRHRQDATACPLSVTRRELRQLLGWSEKAVRVATDRLVALDYLVTAGGGRGRCRTYRVADDLVAMIGGVGPTDERVGPSVGPVGPRQGRTGDPSHAGTTARLAPLARFGDAPVEGGTKHDGGVDERAVGEGGPAPAPAPASGSVAVRS